MKPLTQAIWECCLYELCLSKERLSGWLWKRSIEV